MSDADGTRDAAAAPSAPAPLPDPVGEPFDPATGAPVPPVERPWWAPLTLVAFVALVVCTNVANVVWARWIGDHPERVLALSSRNRYLALALTSGVSIPAYVAIATARIGAAFVVCHLIGRAYAEDAIALFKRYLGFNDDAERTFDRGFEKAEWALIPLFAGSNIVAVLSGVRRTPLPKVLGLLAVGIAGRLAVMWWLAQAFEDQLLDLLEVITRYQWWFIAASLVLVVVANARNLRR
ncbi:hypothetical protein [Ilumatobacter sp.]|uniref:hypothetical protein n=1 Tax=Ilumatobacter sp. TaxID=1967498 RepID=UPI003B5183FE